MALSPHESIYVGASPSTLSLGICCSCDSSLYPGPISVSVPCTFLLPVSQAAEREKRGKRINEVSHKSLMSN